MPFEGMITKSAIFLRLKNIFWLDVTLDCIKIHSIRRILQLDYIPQVFTRMLEYEIGLICTRYRLNDRWSILSAVENAPYHLLTIMSRILHYIQSYVASRHVIPFSFFIFTSSSSSKKSTEKDIHVNVETCLSRWQQDTMINDYTKIVSLILFYSLEKIDWFCAKTDLKFQLDLPR